ncbi:MAG TPA: futalosine hydrolase [Bacteroidia bacterium]|jgi:futalosine hydrolase|nr:futalosine hydrolase [Bacteroidia bacterium]
MRLLLVSATVFEIAPFLKDINASVEGTIFSKYNYKQHQIDILLTGVGATHTAFYLGKYLNNTYDAVINAGICGSFTNKLAIGEVVCIDTDCFADLGAEDDETFLSLEELKLPGTYYVKNENSFNHAILTNLPTVKGVTVNTTHGNTQSIEKFIKRTKADVESMEGAAFLFACNVNKNKCVQIRSVSNYVEKRDRSKWNIVLAIENLNKILIDFIHQ